MVSEQSASAGRRSHYATFYDPQPPPADRPLAVVHGNCQAESLRIVLGGDDLATVRIPPVHELVASDLPSLRRLLARAALLVVQPIRAGYHGLPIGTADVIAATSAHTVLVPVIRFAGLYPTQVIIRPPSNPGLTPPLVPYHELSTLVRAAARRDTPWPRAQRLRSIAELSIAELRRREQLHQTVEVSDLFRQPDFAQMRTINHPGNPVWEALARRVRVTIGMSEAITIPDRPLLNSVHAPRHQVVIEALGLDDEPLEDWLVDGRRLSAERVSEAHLRWYADHPDTVVAGLSRHREVLELLGWQ